MTNRDSPNTALSEPAGVVEAQCWIETPLYAHPPESPSQRTSAIRAQAEAEERARIVAWLRSGPDCTTNCENLAKAIEHGEHLR